MGFGAEVAAVLQYQAFDWLDAPIERVTGGEASPSISKVLERAAFASTEEVVAKLREITQGQNNG
jgi:2-oxoisovalerate dehydrogenase E1 component